MLSDNAPTGEWRNGLCDCCKYGLLHPMLLMAWCCPQILVAQVMTRMKLNFLGKPAPYDEWTKTFRNVWWITVAVFVLRFLTSPTVEVDEDGNPETGTINPTAGFVRSTISFLYTLYIWYILYVTRARVRERYSIPEECCAGCEDMLCAVCCSCCTAAQMADHTADYDVIRATCYTNTGLPKAVNPKAMYEVQEVF